MPKIKRTAGDFGEVPDFAYKHEKKFNAIISLHKHVNYIPSIFAHNNEQARASSDLKGGLSPAFGRQAYSSKKFRRNVNSDGEDSAEDQDKYPMGRYKNIKQEQAHVKKMYENSHGHIKTHRCEWCYNGCNEHNWPENKRRHVPAKLFKLSASNNSHRCLAPIQK